MAFLSLLPLLVLLVLALGRLASEPAEGKPTRSWQTEFVIAVCLWGALLVLVTEGLSLLHAIHRTGLAVAWALILLALVIWGMRSGVPRRSWARIRSELARMPGAERALLTIVIAMGALLLAVALVGPTNNIDTLQYHMPRVNHWAQNQSLEHFPTSYDQENSRPFWSELVILNLRVLWGSDQPATLIQLLTMLISMIAASGLAGLLGGRRDAQWLAALFTFSVPMALLQVTVPKNDITASMWVLLTAYLAVLILSGRLGSVETIALSLAVGLAVLTKGTALIFAAPVLGLFFLALLRKSGWRASIRTGLIVALACVVLNGPFWYRNTLTYGGPFGSRLPVGFAAQSETVAASEGTPDDVALATAQDRAAPIQMECSGPCFQSTRQGSGAGLGGMLQEMALRLARMLAMNFVSPFHVLNQLYFRLLTLLPEVFPPGFVNALEAVAWNNEMTAGNPLHLLLILAALAIGAVRSLRQRIWVLGGLALAALGGYVLVSAASCSDWTICLRYQLPFFLLGGPLVAAVWARRGWSGAYVAASILALYAMPYVLISNMRPVIGHTPWPTRIPSVFTISREQMLFAQSPENMDEYIDLAGRIGEAGCQQVGVALQPGDQEYPVWWLLGAPGSNIRIEHIITTLDTQKLIDPSFTPCAVLCTECSEVSTVTDLPLAFDYGHVKLHMKVAAPAARFSAPASGHGNG